MTPTPRDAREFYEALAWQALKTEGETYDKKLENYVKHINEDVTPSHPMPPIMVFGIRNHMDKLVAE